MRRLTLLLLLASPVAAQVIQSKACPYNAVTIYAEPCAFDKSTQAGDLLVTIQLAEGLITDTQGNSWTLALSTPYYNGVSLRYATAQAGQDTVLFGGTPRLAFIAEYPPSTGLDDANYGTYFAQNPHGDAQGQSSDTGSTMVLATSQPGDLLISFGWSGGPMIGDGIAENAQWIIKPGPDFTLRGQQYGGFALEDSVTTIPGAYFGTITWAGYGHWVLGAAVFKMKTPLVKPCVN